MIYNEYFDICVENSLKSYNKIKKYFKALKPRFKIGFYKGNGPKILKNYKLNNNEFNT